MELLGNKRKESFNWIYLLVFAILSIVLMTFYARESDDGFLHRVQDSCKVVFTPASHLGAIISSPINNLGNAISNLGTSPSEISALKQQNQELMGQVMQLEEYRQQAQRLEELLAIRDAYNVQAEGASIIGRSANSWSFTIEINKGSRDGMEPGMPVMNSVGLLGQIESVSLLSSTVRLISDEQSGVAAMIQSTRCEGILRGSVNGTLYLDYIGMDQEVQVGDIVITSGMGGVYPKGIAIGEIVDVSGSENDLYHTIVVKPLSTADYSEEVLVLTGNETQLIEQDFSKPDDTSSDTVTVDVSKEADSSENVASDNASVSSDTSQSTTESSSSDVSSQSQGGANNG